MSQIGSPMLCTIMVLILVFPQLFKGEVKSYKCKAYHCPKNIKGLQRNPLDPTVSLQKDNIPYPRIFAGMLGNWSNNRTETWKET